MPRLGTDEDGPEQATSREPTVLLGAKVKAKISETSCYGREAGRASIVAKTERARVVLYLGCPLRTAGDSLEAPRCAGDSAHGKVGTEAEPLAELTITESMNHSVARGFKSAADGRSVVAGMGEGLQGGVQRSLLGGLQIQGYYDRIRFYWLPLRIGSKGAFADDVIPVL